MGGGLSHLVEPRRRELSPALQTPTSTSLLVNWGSTVEARLAESVSGNRQADTRQDAIY